MLKIRGNIHLNENETVSRIIKQYPIKWRENNMVFPNVEVKYKLIWGIDTSMIKILPPPLNFCGIPYLHAVLAIHTCYSHLVGPAPP